MPRLPALVLSLLLATALHVDWHLARPAHHRLSLDWPYHWLATAFVFAVVGCLTARTWPNVRWRLGAWVFVAAVLLAQGIEPVLEVFVYEARLGYPDEPARWIVFGKTLLAATPAFWSAVWLCVRSGPGRHVGAVVP